MPNWSIGKQLRARSGTRVILGTFQASGIGKLIGCFEHSILATVVGLLTVRMRDRVAIKNIITELKADVF